MRIEPYVHFSGCCEEAIEFYRQSVGAELSMLVRYRDSPTPPPPEMMPPGAENQVMHANLRIGDTCLMVSDDCSGTQGPFQGFKLSLSVRDGAEAERCFTALQQGGRVRMPLDKTYFAERFGMLTDRYGVPWMVIAPPVE